MTFSASFSTEREAGEYVVNYYRDLAAAYARKSVISSRRFTEMANKAAERYGVVCDS